MASRSERTSAQPRGLQDRDNARVGAAITPIAKPITRPIVRIRPTPSITSTDRPDKIRNLAKHGTHKIVHITEITTKQKQANNR